jgi:hypothetical protein
MNIEAPERDINAEARDGVNVWSRRLIDLASANGWMVTEFSARSPGYIQLEDSNGTTVEIRSPYGLDTPYYVEQFKARPR